MNLTVDCKTDRIFAYRAFSITWSASMQIYGTKEGLYIGKGINSHRIGLEHQYGRRDVMWKRSIQVRASSQTKGLERVSKQRARLGRDAKNTFFFLASHALRARKARARRARKTLTPRLPISLLILRKKPTDLQSNLTRKYLFMCRYVTRFKFTFLPFAVKVILNNLSINSKIGRQRKMAPLTSVIGPLMSFPYDTCG